jgi:phosphoglycerol transferase MdoB-like AlkP superfamily enzyme
MIFGDHYAYGIDRDTIWEYDDMKDDGSDMDIHNVPMIVYSSSALLKGTVSNYMSSIDIMPTISNLFDLNFDYTKVFGIDALDKENNNVRFADMSFVSEHYSYDSLSEQYFVEEGYVMKEEELLGIYHKIVNDYMYNLLVLQYDYFKEEEVTP